MDCVDENCFRWVSNLCIEVLNRLVGGTDRGVVGGKSTFDKSALKKTLRVPRNEDGADDERPITHLFDDVTLAICVLFV